MDDTQRRLYLNNWAILITENEIKWYFGDINKEKMEQTLDFVTFMVNNFTRMGIGEQEDTNYLEEKNNDFSFLFDVLILKYKAFLDTYSRYYCLRVKKRIGITNVE